MSAANLNLNETAKQSTVAQGPAKPKTVIFFMAAAIVGIGIAIFTHQVKPNQTAADQSHPVSPAEMTVSVVHPEKVPSSMLLDLPGQLQAYTDAPIFAQTSGYLKAWHFDIGAKVKANDILAEIDTPEVDQELAQAKAQLQVAQSALKLSQVTYQRNQDLFNQRVIAPQDLDTAADTYYENQATVAADEANIDRLNALEAFKLVRAPFDGIVTARDTDIGAYVAAGSGSQLFRVAQTSPLRIYVNVSQEFAQLVKVGVAGDLTVPEFPGRTFPAHVTNVAGAVDPISRSLQTELQIPNETGELLPGAYADVRLRLHGDRGLVMIPSNAWLFRRDGATVGVFHPDGKVEIRKVTIHLNLGNKLEVSQGLSDSDRVIVNPSDGLANGMNVNVIGPNEPPGTADSVTKR
ncbi:MAG TPA: efflux RND transporter periplasmic adaptor subunit [Chthoniobacterales bacterium]|nr:efflux RND transporter periplasmic adaptor subunit [Chthoniobacterales bacterium]